MIDKIERYKKDLQNSLLFDYDEGFDVKNFRKKCNPEVDYDVVEDIVNKIRRSERDLILSKLRYHLSKFTILYGSKDLTTKEFLKECGLDKSNETESK